MANVTDYLTWRGDVSLEERPFNDADNLVLSCLSYFDFTGIVPTEQEGGSISVMKACRKLIKKGNGNVKQFVRALAHLDTKFVENLASSARFGTAELSAYVDVVDEDRSLQFSAIQIDLPTRVTFVSFRGTDSTLVGWREDFMLSFQVTEAQRQAVGYLERAIKRAIERGNPVMVGGHSKGGNLAEYAAVNCSEELRRHIVCVYSNDGPGMAPELTSCDPEKVLGDRLRLIVPAYSIVGMLFSKVNQRRTIVRSKVVGIGQHDPSTWQLTPKGFFAAPKLERDCMIINDAIAKWARSVPLDDRERFVNEVFDCLGAGGAKSLDQIGDSVEGLQKVISAFKATDKSTRELASALLETTVNNSVDAVRHAARKVVRQWRDDLLGSAGGAAKKLLGVNEARMNAALDTDDERV